MTQVREKLVSMCVLEYWARPLSKMSASTNTEADGRLYNHTSNTRTLLYRGFIPMSVPLICMAAGLQIPYRVIFCRCNFFAFGSRQDKMT